MATPSHTARKASTSAHKPPSRPTTPLRPPSRTSLRASQTTPSNANFSQSGHGDNPLATLEPAFAELSDSMADLELNFTHLQLLNESLSRFNECFGSFLYGLNMSAFTVDFPEAPIPQSFARHQAKSPQATTQSPFHDSRTRNYDGTAAAPREHDVDATFLTTDTSFVENPPTSSKPSNRYSSVPPSALSQRRSVPSASSRGRGGAAARVTRGSSIGRGSAAGRGTAGPMRGARGSGTAGRGRGLR